MSTPHSNSTLAPPEGVDPATWAKLATEVDGCWAIKERNAQGEVIGTAYRALDGSKSFEPGGKRGLIVEWPLDTYAGSSAASPVYVCEGASDTAALMSLGLDAIGVPMAGQCGAMLAEVLADRHSVIVSDNDEAGHNGTQKLTEQLVRSCASLRVISPPTDSKDARAAVNAGSLAADFEALASMNDSIPIPPQCVSGTESNFTWLSIEDIGPAEPANWIWPGYIARGTITLLTGLWKAGKTTLVANLLHDLYRGEGLIETPIDGSVLVVSEESTGMWSRRRDEFELASQIHLLRRDTYARLSYTEWCALIDDICQNIKLLGVSLVIIDTLSSFWPVDNENDASEVNTALAPLRGITEAGASLLLNHHPRKGSGSNFTASRGSGALPSFVDILVELDYTNRECNTDTRRTLSAKGRLDDIPAEMVIDLTDDGYVMLGEVSVSNRQSELDTIDSLLADLPDGATVTVLKEHWPEKAIGKRRLSGLLKQGTDDGRWERKGNGAKGSPHVYHKRRSSIDSIPFRTDTGDGTESNPTRPNESAGTD